MDSARTSRAGNVFRDLTAGLIVFLVALPLCLGIALASNAPLFSGLIAGIVGGIVVGSISGSHTSVSGPAAGLTAIVAAQIAQLGSFEAFLLAVVLGGVLQIVLGIIKAGALSAFFPSSVIKGLLAAIGVILVLKQIPHLLGHDQDPEGEMSFEQPDEENTFSELLQLFSGDLHTGALTIGLISLVFLLAWDRVERLKNSLIPAPLLVVILGVVLGRIFEFWGSPWQIETSHLVQVPVAGSLQEFASFLRFPDFAQILNPAIYIAAVTIAVVASLETLLNLDAVDNLDRKQRRSPPSRELLAQGIGNVTAGMLGGIPVTSVVIRGSVNVMAGAESKASTIIHGCLLLISVMILPTYINYIPLSCLAAILLITGFKLASPKLFRQMWSAGPYQFLPFILTLVAIVLTDLLIGILLGLAISLIFILNSSLRVPIRRIREKHIGGEILHIELANQVSFLNRAALEKALREVPRGGRVLLDARRTDYIDPDILSLIREFKNVTAPVYDVRVGLVGFRERYNLEDTVQTVDFSAQESRELLTPAQVLQVLQEGNKRFVEGHPLDRDLRHQTVGRLRDPRPIAAIFTGVDSRTPAEMIFDLGLGDAYVVRTPGIAVGPEAVAALEYACIDGVKLIVIMGRTDSRLVSSAIDALIDPEESSRLIGTVNLQPIIANIQQSIEPAEVDSVRRLEDSERQRWVDWIKRKHVLRSVNQLMLKSDFIRRLSEDRQVQVVAAMYSIATGDVEFFDQSDLNREHPETVAGVQRADSV